MTPEQPHRWYVVLDFEATCNGREPPQPQEVIELPSVLICSRTLEVVDDFCSFVRPRFHPKLFPFCTSLTGITQAEVDPAPDFVHAYALHRQWLRGHGLRVDADDDGEDFSFVLCGDWDLQRMFPVQCRASSPPIDYIPLAWRRWVNIKRTFEDVMGERPRGMVSMLDSLELALLGRHHRGIDDCHNIASITTELVRRGAVLGQTSVLSSRQYPPVSLVLTHEGQQAEIVLRRRHLATLLEVASEAFRTEVEWARDADDRLLTESALLELRGGAVLTVGA